MSKKCRGSLTFLNWKCSCRMPYKVWESVTAFTRVYEREQGTGGVEPETCKSRLRVKRLYNWVA